MPKITKRANCYTKKKLSVTNVKTDTYRKASLKQKKILQERQKVNPRSILTAYWQVGYQN